MPSRVNSSHINQHFFKIKKEKIKISLNNTALNQIINEKLIHCNQESLNTI